MASFIKIVFFLLLFNASLGWLNDWGIFNGYQSESYSSTLANTVTIDQTSASNIQASGPIDYLKDVLAMLPFVPQGLLVMLKSLAYGLFGLPIMLYKFGLTTSFVSLVLVTPLGFMFLMFVYQSITGRSHKLID